jgi:hypothetical protein
MPIKKAAKRKPAKVPKGLHLKRSPNGEFYMSIHFGNGNKSTAIRGYNTKQATLKGLLALNRALNEAFDTLTSKYTYTDHTKVKKA